MSGKSRDQWAKELLTSTLALAWHASDPQARKVADAAAVEVEKVERRAKREASGFRVMCEALERLKKIVGLDTGGGMGPGPALNAVEHIIRQRDALAAHHAKLVERGNELHAQLKHWAGAEHYPPTYGAMDSWTFAVEEAPAESLAKLKEERDAVTSPDRDMVAHMHRQIAFSSRAFGPGDRQAGVIDHIRKELHEIEEAPQDLEEWIDVVLLALDGAWRSGHSAEEVVAMLDAKMTKNENREWPDWRTADRTKAIEHDRTKGKEARP